MDLVTALAATLVGLLAGVAIGVAVSRSATRQATPSAPRPIVEPLPAGLADVLNVLRSASVVLDRSGNLVKTSPAAHAFGLVRGRDLAHADLRAMVLEATSLRLVREQELVLPLGPLGRESLNVFARVAPLTDDLTLLLVEDRTEAKRVEDVRRDFVANVSHELKTPIGALHLLAEAVTDAADDAGAVRHFAKRMLRESSRLGLLVQDIIDLSRLQVTDALQSVQPAAVDEVVSDAVDRCRTAASAKQIEVVVGGEEGAVVYGDHGLLVTAVRNLVDNAISYSEAQTRIGVAVRSREGIVEIAVSDQGIGIGSAEQERIFERFYRTDPARSRSTGGTGLGLSIVKHVAANHGGEVTVWSVPGQGSTFTLRLPESVQPIGAVAVPAPERPERPERPTRAEREEITS